MKKINPAQLAGSTSSQLAAEVVDLKRLSFGGIGLNNLPTGKTRFLERSEYVHLREFLDAERDAEKLKKIQEQDSHIFYFFSL